MVAQKRQEFKGAFYAFCAISCGILAYFSGTPDPRKEGK
jgi:hypothetical protein